MHRSHPENQNRPWKPKGGLAATAVAISKLDDRGNGSLAPQKGHLPTGW
jgi:hypothetical protein